MQVGAKLVDNTTCRKRWILHIPAFLVRVLAQTLSVFIHRPEIHHTIAITQEVDATLPVHGVLTGAGIAGGERDGFLTRQILPKALRGSTLVTFGVASLEGEASEKESLAGAVVRALRGLT